MEMIVSQPFVKVLRTIQNNQQQYIEQHEALNLYEDKIIASSQLFHLKDVFDMSYKSFSQDYGLLYLHTRQGVIPFMVKSNPHRLIQEFKKLK